MAGTRYHLKGGPLRLPLGWQRYRLLNKTNDRPH